MNRLLITLFLASFAPITKAAEPFFVDLAPIATTSLENDGASGWSNEGVNDMFIYPPIPSGEVTRNGHRFKLLDPSQNNGKTIVMLKGRHLPNLPQEATATVPEAKGKYIYFLQNSVRSVEGQPQNYKLATYTIKYADGSEAQIPIHDGVEIRKWWTGQWYDNSGAKSWPIFIGRNSVSMKYNQLVGVWSMQWTNPSPDKPIRSIEFQSEGLASPAIFAVTITDEDYYNSPNVKADYKRPPDVPADFFQKKLAKQQEVLFQEMLKLKMAQGIRRVDLIRPDVIAVTLDAAVARGAGLANERAEALQDVATFSVSSDGDDAYKSAQHAQKIGRLSYEHWNGDVGSFDQNIFYWHIYYLFLPTPLKSGQTYRVALKEGVLGPESASLTQQLTFNYDERATITPVIKVNQAGYSSLAKRRYAYLGYWAGDAGKVDFVQFKQFQVIDENGNATAHKGEIAPRKSGDPLSGEDVYQMDLSSLKPGKYHIAVPGLGRSDSFAVGGEAIRDLYYHSNRAFFHQRCGHELKAPYSEFAKDICHTEVWEGGYLVGNPAYTPKPDEAKRSFRGGYHDAADFDVFTYHLRATAQLLTAYEFAPEKFKDGDLNIPESGNKIPDVLDEADWALFSFRDTQQEDGGVPLGRGNDEDAIRDYEREHGGTRPPFGLLPPRSTSCTEYAAVAAQYARLIRSFDAPRADRYIGSARRAYAWAQKHPRTGNAEQGDQMFFAWAAAELYNATGEESFNDGFKRLHAAGALKNIHWKMFATAPICLWPYIGCQQPGADKKIQEELRVDAIKRADEIVKQTEAPPYRVGRGAADGGNGWGNLNGGGRYADPLLRAYILTRDQKYIDAACLNADFQLGANPLSKTFITGVGTRPPLHPQISAFLYTGAGKTGSTVKGITIYGLTSDEPKWHPSPIPSWRRWRDLGNGGAEVSSEFTITETIGYSAMLYSMLYSLEN